MLCWHIQLINILLIDLSLFKPTIRKSQYFKKGDVVFKEGMIADGFYIVQRGEFKNTYKKTKDGKVFKKFYKKGDHFGSRVILQGGRRTGTITALKDSEVLKIDLDGFKLMASNLPALKKYFSDYLPNNFNNLKLKV